MSRLLNKRLARSLWRTKLRLIAVIFMVSVGVFAGLTFGGYSHNLEGMYDTMHADDEDGANLADLWIDNRTTVWSKDEVSQLCNEIEQSWNFSSGLDSCEGRLIVQGAMFLTVDNEDKIINSLWHGISPNANADRIWMPSGHSKGDLAIAVPAVAPEE